MTHVYEKPFNVYEQLGLIRMGAAKRREAIARMKRAEAIADLTLSRARLALAEFKNRPRLPQEFVDMTSANRTPLIHSRLDAASQRLLVKAVLAEARRMRAEAIRDLLRQAASFVYRTIAAGTAQIVRRIIQGVVQGSGHRTGKSFDTEM